MTTPRQVVAELRNIRLIFGSRIILNDLDLKIHAAEIYALIGGNGAGKSSTLNLLLGFKHAQQGDVIIQGKTVLPHQHQHLQSITYIPEQVVLYPHLNAIENLDYLSKLSGQRHSAEVIEQALVRTHFPISQARQQLISFSKGMRQKVAIALAILRRSQLILLDEPTSGLDPAAIHEFTSILQELRAQGSAILMVTHDLLSASDTADRIGLLAAGKVRCEYNRPEFAQLPLQQIHQLYQYEPPHD